MSRVIRRIAPFAAVCVVVMLTLPASSSAATCRLSPSTARNMGPTYVIEAQLKQTGTSCSNAVRVTRAFHSCRLRRGKRGRCTTAVRGYSCRDRRPSDESIATQFTGHVTCRRGGARITHSYQQDT